LLILPQNACTKKIVSPTKTDFFMRTSTLTRRLRVWEQLFNQTQTGNKLRGKGGVTTTSATRMKSDGVVSMWSQVEAAPKVQNVIFLSFISSLLGVFGRQRTSRVVGVLQSVSFREKPFADFVLYRSRLVLLLFLS